MNIIFIGCGNMGEALLKASKQEDIDRIFVMEKNKDRVQELRSKYENIDFIDALSQADTPCLVVFAVKPQDKKEAKSLLKDIDGEFGILSIMAGVTTGFFKDSRATEIIRAMPNLPALVGKGVTGVFSQVKGPFYEKAVRILKGIGEIIEVDEDKMDLITAITGSGPAYFFFLCQCLYEFAVDRGLEPGQADLAVRQLALGSADFMLKYKDIDFELMRKKVTSKGGTTQAAFDVLGHTRVCEVFKKAFNAALERAKELSQ